MLDSIENGIFRELPIPLQHNLSNNVISMFNSPGNQNQFTISVQNTFHHMVVGGLEFKLKNLEKFRTALKDVSSLKRKFNSTLNQLEKVETQVEEIQKLNVNAKTIFDELSEANKKSITVVESSIKGLKNVEDIAVMAKEKEQVVENSKKDIIAFKENIDSYKKDIEKSSKKSDSIIADFESKRKQVEELIKDSEKALSLKASEGMSAALSAQYDKEGKINKRRQWLIMASIFIFLTLVGLGLLIFEVSFGDKLINPDSPNAIIARVVFVGITVAGASFAAKQYLNQKRLSDDYAYKLVLAKSIVAFAQEIKKHDPEKAAEYMTNVLKELNRSPLQKECKNEGINIESVSVLERLQSIFIPK